MYPRLREGGQYKRIWYFATILSVRLSFSINPAKNTSSSGGAGQPSADAMEVVEVARAERGKSKLYCLHLSCGN